MTCGGNAIQKKGGTHTLKDRGGRMQQTPIQNQARKKGPRKDRRGRKIRKGKRRGAPIARATRVIIRSAEERRRRKKGTKVSRPGEPWITGWGPAK